jgi:anti-sigma B factor antagonist
MLDIRQDDDGVIAFEGRLDAAQAAKAQSFLDGAADPRVLDFSKLNYISSAGLGVLLKTQKRLAASGRGLTLVNVSKHIYDVFNYSGLDQIFEIRAVEPE